MTARGKLLGRVAVFWIGYFAILFAAGMLKAMVSLPWQQAAWGYASAAGILVMTLLFLRRERRGADEIGLRPDGGSLRRSGLGLLIGFALYGVHLLILTTIGGLRLVPTGAGSAGMLFLGVCTFVGLSCMEELGFRGYALRSLTPAFGLWPALAITAGVFAFSHVLFGWPWMAIVFGVVPGAFLFGMAAIASRGLALPIGLHAAWNLAGWAVGEKGTPTIWKFVVVDQSRAAVVPSVSFVAVFVGATLAFWWYAKRLRRN